MISNIDKYIHLFYTSPMKLSQYAKQQGISYRTALRWFRDGAIKGYQAPSGRRNSKKFAEQIKTWIEQLMKAEGE
jgi:predicted site-specific integrase-resolvase